MHALIIVAHPNPESFSHSIANQIAKGISTEAGHSWEVADLAAEGFDPRFGLADVAVHKGEALPPPDVAFEQQRIDRAHALVLVYPVYWWSMPALLKGWIDRVFSKGWAFNEGPVGLEKKLEHLAVHLVAIAGADLPTYKRHGYLKAMQTQIDYGIFQFCGARVETSNILALEGAADLGELLAAAHSIGANLVHLERVPRR